MHRTCLSIERVEFQVHRTGESERHTDAEEDSAIRVNPDIEVGHQDVVHGSSSLIPEERVWHPHLARLSDCQIFDFICKEFIISLIKTLADLSLLD